MLEIKDLNYTYAGANKKALDNINLSIKPGSIYGLLGANGAGKSTLIKCLVGILEPNGGKILFENKDISKDIEAYKQNMGYVPDLNNAYERISGLHYLMRIADILGITDRNKAKQIIDKYVTKFEMEDIINQPIKTYSHGTKQKLNFIAGIMHEPKLLILDEPMTGLDPKSTLSLIEIVKDYASKGNTILFSSHLLNVVENLCDKVGIIKKGVMVGEYDLKNEKGEIKKMFLDFNKA